MAQPKGKTGNPNGRPKGTPNKVTTEMRLWLSQLIDNNRKQIEKDLKLLEPKERLQVLEKFMGYTLPKLQSVEAKVELDKLSDEQLDTIINEITKGVE